MILWTAFFLGFAGSLHCAGMCGPLALAVPVVGQGRSAFFFSRLVYNLGRVATYCLIGLLFGLFGKTLALAGFQRWLSLGAGILILLALLGAWTKVQFSTVRLIAKLKSQFAALLHRRTYPSLLGLGALNGALPCGLVYVAAAAAIATGSPLHAAAYMLTFGLGTLPMMLGIAYAGRKFAFSAKLRPLIPASMALVAVLLILRGLSLGIPYLSPDLSSGAAHCAACH